MNSTLVTVVGNVATTPDFRLSQNNTPSCRFRLATTERRFDQAANGWVDGATSFYTVWTNRALAEHAASSLGIGDPVILQGRLRVREWEHEGKQYSDAQIEASAIGHDLARGTSAFHRVPRAKPESDGAEVAEKERDAEPALSGAAG